MKHRLQVMEFPAGKQKQILDQRLLDASLGKFGENLGGGWMAGGIDGDFSASTRVAPTDIAIGKALAQGDVDTTVGGKRCGGGAEGGDDDGRGHGGSLPGLKGNGLSLTVTGTIPCLNHPPSFFLARLLLLLYLSAHPRQ